MPRTGRHARRRLPSPRPHLHRQPPPGHLFHRQRHPARHRLLLRMGTHHRQPAAAGSSRRTPPEGLPACRFPACRRLALAAGNSTRTVATLLGNDDPGHGTAQHRLARHPGADARCRAAARPPGQRPRRGKRADARLDQLRRRHAALRGPVGGGPRLRHHLPPRPERQYTAGR
ncbi:hypothetical protein SDC9_170768 [bioreactor metagenome]|uniref:Uncharacterized protein n=1 Tax=bioreactor metagenome TaxID=1076179 RepID=A0A645GBF7_9ZZZZ